MKITHGSTQDANSFSCPSLLNIDIMNDITALISNILTNGSSNYSFIFSHIDSPSSLSRQFLPHFYYRSLTYFISSPYYLLLPNIFINSVSDFVWYFSFLLCFSLFLLSFSESLINSIQIIIIYINNTCSILNNRINTFEIL